MIDNQLDNLDDAALKPSVVDRWLDGFTADALGGDGEGSAEFPQYAEDPVGFVRDIFGIRLTEDQIALLEAIRDYEIVQVRSATGVGKTYVLALAGIWVYKTMDGTKVYTAAAPPEENLRDLLWGEIFDLTDNKFPHLFVKDTVSSNMRIKRSPKEFIIGVRIPQSASDQDIETKFSGKHAAHLVFLFDEGDAIPDPVYKGADGCMSGGWVRQVVCYNPKKRQGTAWRRQSTGAAKILTMSALNHPNVISGRDEIPGAVTREKTVQRINVWTEALGPDEVKDDDCWRVPDFLVGTTARMPNGEGNYPPLKAGWRRIVDQQFYYKVLGEYPRAGSDQLIQQSWIDAAVSRWEMMRAGNGGVIKPPEGIQPIMGMDVAGSGPDDNTAVFRYGIWVDVPTFWSEGDPDLAALRAARLYVERNAKICHVDGTGVGAGVPGRMTRQSRELKTVINAVSIMVGERSAGYTEDGDFYGLRDEAYWNLREAFRTGNIAIPPETNGQACQRLHAALNILTYEHLGTSIKIIKKKDMRQKLEGSSPDELEALMLTYAPANTWFGAI